MEKVLAFSVRVRPRSTNNLYGSRIVRSRRTRKFVPKRYKTAEAEPYTEAIVSAALDAADACEWDLAYTGPAHVVIIDYRPTATGLDWDNIPKALQDALCPQIMRNDRNVWHGEVLIATDPRDPRVVVIIERTTREAVAALAKEKARGL